jgi:hypothetical protein
MFHTSVLHFPRDKNCCVSLKQKPKWVAASSFNAQNTVLAYTRTHAHTKKFVQQSSCYFFPPLSADSFYRNVYLLTYLFICWVILHSSGSVSANTRFPSVHIPWVSPGLKYSPNTMLTTMHFFSVTSTSFIFSFIAYRIYVQSRARSPPLLFSFLHMIFPFAFNHVSDST